MYDISPKHFKVHFFQNYSLPINEYLILYKGNAKCTFRKAEIISGNAKCLHFPEGFPLLYCLSKVSSPFVAEL